MLLKIRETGVRSGPVKQVIMRHVRKFIQDTVTDDLQLLEVVGGGPFQFRVRFIKAFPAGMVDETIANHVFAFLSDVVVRKFGDAHTTKELLDSLEVVQHAPPTAQEIADGWQIESASSEEARRAFGLPTGDTRGVEDAPTLGEVPDADA